MLYILAILVSLYATAYAQGNFISPPDGDDSNTNSSNWQALAQNPEYPFGTTLNLTWSSSLSRVSVILWQIGNDNLETIAYNISNTDSHSWTIDTAFAYQSQTVNNGEVFQLAIYEPGDTSPAFSSRYFNITAPVATTVTTASFASATASLKQTATVATAVSASATAAIVTSAASDSGAPSSSGSNSVALGAGLGVGLGVAALGAIGALIWFLRRRKQKKADESIGIVSGGQYGAGPGAAAASGGYKSAVGGVHYAPTQPPEKGPLLQHNEPAEMMDSSADRTYEMDGAVPETRTMHELPTVETR